VLGGLGTLWGAIIGGIVVEFLPLWAQAINPAASSIVYGVALIVVMLVVPGGIAGGIARALRRFGAAPGFAAAALDEPAPGLPSSPIGQHPSNS
jgi:branched-chain amino acid transport system permease protein